MSRMPLVALALAVGISTLVLGTPALPNAPAAGASSAGRSVIHLSAGEKGSVWLAIGINEGGPSLSDMYSRILLYRIPSASRRWERVLDLAGTRSLEGLWVFGSGRIMAWFHEPTRDVIFHTADGGNRWRSSILRFAPPAGFNGEIDFMSFINLREGWMLVTEWAGMHQGHFVLYHTQDGGEHWKEIAQAIPWQSSPSDLGTESKTGIAFRDANLGWIGTNPITGRGYLTMSRDGGATWEEQSLPPPPGRSPFDFLRVWPPRFFGTRHGVAVADMMKGTFAYQTSDGGLAWGDPRPFPAMRADFPRAWDMLSPTRWAVGSDRTLWLTSDGGRTWSEQSVPLPPTHKIHRIAYVGPSRIWLIGYQDLLADYILETRDAGRRWTRVPLPPIP